MDESKKEVFLEEFSEMLDTISTLKQSINLLSKQLKNMEKKVKHKMKKMDKQINKTKVNKKKKPSGFACPQNISPELCDFMGLEPDTKIARTEVTKYLIDYIKKNKLQDETNSKIIKPNNKLKLLLSLEPEMQLTYFNMQKFMNKHFVNKH